MGRADLNEGLIVRCVDCLLYDPDFLEDDGYCSVCGKPLGPKVAGESVAASPAVEAAPPAVLSCRLCGAPAGPDGGFCTACELMVLGELDVHDTATSVETAQRTDADGASTEPHLQTWWVPQPEAVQSAATPPTPESQPEPAMVAEPEPASSPPLELESWWVPPCPHNDAPVLAAVPALAVAPPQEPPHEELPEESLALELRCVAEAPAEAEPPVASWLVPPPSEPAPPIANEPPLSDAPGPWWAPTPPPLLPDPPSSAPEPGPPAAEPVSAASSDPDHVGLKPPPLAVPRPTTPGGPMAGRVVRPSYSASTRPVPRGPVSTSPARRQVRTRRPVQAAAIRQPFLVAAMLAVTVGASYAAHEWFAGRLTLGSEPALIQARPAFTVAMTGSPVVVATPPPRDFQARAAEAPSVPTSLASTVSAAVANATAAATGKGARPTTAMTKAKAARNPPTSGRSVTPAKPEVRPAATTPTSVVAMSPPPQANMSPSPAEVTAARPADPAPEPVQKSQVFEISQVDVRPEVASRTEPSYPSGARERGLEDVVVVRVLVNPNGRAAETQLLRRSKLDAAFDNAALSAVRKWTFTPARKRDRLVSCWMSVGIPFRMPRVEGSQ